MSKEQLMTYLQKVEEAVLRSYHHPDQLTVNLNLLDVADEMFEEKYDFPFFRHAIRERVMRNFIETRVSEKDVHDWFKENVNALVGRDYKITKRKNNPKHIPDFWLKKLGTYVPVEIKLHEFDPRHLKQLQRYMNFYQCSEGFAVAKELNCELPCNVTFIKHGLT